MTKHRPYLYLARSKAPTFLKEGYKERKNTHVAGVAQSGEISDRGMVAHTEDWEGRIASKALPPTVRYVRDPSHPRGARPMTMQEMIDRGLFILGRGPEGMSARGVTA
jgi:hypothetical protein